MTLHDFLHLNEKFLKVILDRNDLTNDYFVKFPVGSVDTTAANLTNQKFAVLLNHLIYLFLFVFDYMICIYFYIFLFRFI